MTGLKVGDMVWTLTKEGDFQHRKVDMIFPYTISTELLEGEPTQDPLTGDFILRKYHHNLEVGRTREELLNNRISLEETNILKAETEIARSKKMICFFNIKLKEL